MKITLEIKFLAQILQTQIIMMKLMNLLHMIWDLLNFSSLGFLSLKNLNTNTKMLNIIIKCKYFKQLANSIHSFSKKNSEILSNIFNSSICRMLLKKNLKLVHIKQKSIINLKNRLTIITKMMKSRRKKINNSNKKKKTRKKSMKMKTRGLMRKK